MRCLFNVMIALIAFTIMSKEYRMQACSITERTQTERAYAELLDARLDYAFCTSSGNDCHNYHPYFNGMLYLKFYVEGTDCLVVHKCRNTSSPSTLNIIMRYTFDCNPDGDIIETTLSIADLGTQINYTAYNLDSTYCYESKTYSINDLIDESDLEALKGCAGVETAGIEDFNRSITKVGGNVQIQHPEDAIISVYDTCGRLLHMLKCSGTETSIPTEQFSKGINLIIIKHKNNITQHKIIL